MVDGARYGDMEDIEQALGQGTPVDGKDSGGRTGANLMPCIEVAYDLAWRGEAHACK